MRNSTGWLSGTEPSSAGGGSELPLHQHTLLWLREAGGNAVNGSRAPCTRRYSSLLGPRRADVAHAGISNGGAFATHTDVPEKATVTRACLGSARVTI
jgi:hypothetical protein